MCVCVCVCVCSRAWDYPYIDMHGETRPRDKAMLPLLIFPFLWRCLSLSCHHPSPSHHNTHTHILTPPTKKLHLTHTQSTTSAKTLASKRTSTAAAPTWRRPLSARNVRLCVCVCVCVCIYVFPPSFIEFASFFIVCLSFHLPYIHYSPLPPSHTDTHTHTHTHTHSRRRERPFAKWHACVADCEPPRNLGGPL
jgi:hypothetical protein